ncbi:MAG: UV DNA damage repair endonuclease UvsE [Verrucomicrobiota bacterium]|nr:UV DNA damage repair endonuclease UvsE [Verrucomicrobiota bacterium]
METEAGHQFTTKLGLVCITHGEEIRYRTITRSRFLGLGPIQAEEALRSIYKDNLQKFLQAIDYCRANRIHLYRLLCGLFPMVDYPAGAKVYAELSEHFPIIGKIARKQGLRIIMHPDQYVVLNSERPAVVKQSIGIMQEHARLFDSFGLPQTPWAAFILHGGKSGRAEQLCETIAGLPPNIRKRLVLENDEHAYSAAEILEICKQSEIPMVFDPHHHVIKEKLSSYRDASVAYFLEAAAETWPKREWQIAHISNGATHFLDQKHSDLITDFPEALFSVPYVEIEAKHKEHALSALRLRYPQLG